VTSIHTASHPLRSVSVWSLRLFGVRCRSCLSNRNKVKKTVKEKNESRQKKFAWQSWRRTAPAPAPHRPRPSTIDHRTGIASHRTGIASTMHRHRLGMAGKLVSAWQAGVSSVRFKQADDMARLGMAWLGTAWQASD
jgi:hypothetical protein